MDGRVRRRAQIFVDGDAEVVMFDTAGVEVEVIDIGDAAGAIDYPIGDDGLLFAVRGEHGAELIAGFLHPGNLDAGMDVDADGLAFLPDLLDRVRVESG